MYTFTLQTVRNAKQNILLTLPREQQNQPGVTKTEQPAEWKPADSAFVRVESGNCREMNQHRYFSCETGY